MLLLASLVLATALPQNTTQVGSINQQSSGPCAYNAAAVQGPSTVIIICPGIEPGTLRRLKEFLAKQSQTSKQTTNQLNSAEDWRRKFELLEGELVSARIWEGQSRAAWEDIRVGDFDKAESELVGLEQQNSTNPDRLAEVHYSLGLLHQLQFDYPKSFAGYASAYRYRPDKFALCYGESLLMQGKFSESEPILQTALIHLKDLEKTTVPETYTVTMAVALNDIANAYNFRNRVKEAEEYYEQAISRWRSLTRAHSGVYETDLAIGLNNLGALYDNTDRVREAERCLKESQAILERRANANATGYEQWLAMTLENLGSVYEDLYSHDNSEQSFEDAKRCFERSIKIRQALASSHDFVFAPSIAETLNNLGNLYHDADKLEDAERVYNQALEVAQRVTDIAPYHKWLVGMVLSNLGFLYLAEKRDFEAEHMDSDLGPHPKKPQGGDPYLQKAESAFLKSLTVYQELAKAEPAAYQKNVSAELDGLSSVYCEMQRANECMAKQVEALTIDLEAATSNPNIWSYHRDVALGLKRLAVLEWNSGMLKEAEKSFNQAVDVLQRLPDDERMINKQSLGHALFELENFYWSTNQMDQAAATTEQLISIYTALAKLNPGEYEGAIKFERNQLEQIRKRAKPKEQQPSASPPTTPNP